MSNIEEDIKIIESMMEEYENCSVLEIDMQVDITFRKKQAKAIEHILSELKKANKQLDLDYVDKNFIEKQKVKEKMEELNKEIKNGDEIEAIFKIKQQQILQELLEESK